MIVEEIDVALADQVTVGLDIGGTKISAVLVTATGRVVARCTVPAPALLGAVAMVDTAASLVESLVLAVPGKATAVGVGAAGVVDHRTGSIRAASELFPGWAGFPLADELRERLRMPVHVENDVNAFLLGEAMWGVVSQPDVVGVMLGTGVGGAVMLDGELRHGPSGSAGEIGHTPGYGTLRCTCGQVGHLETLASGTSISARYGDLNDEPNLPAREIAARARRGDAVARRVFDDAAVALTLAIVTAANVLDITQAVVGGGVATAWDLLEPAIDSTLASNPPLAGEVLTIEPAGLGGDAVALGAAASVTKALAVTVA